MRVQQLSDKVFVKTLEPVESKLLERIKREEKERLEFSYRLQAQQKKLAESIAVLTGAVDNLSNLLTQLTGQVQALERSVKELQPGNLPAVDTYSRAEIDGMLTAYYVEEIAVPYGVPDNQLFDSVPQEKKLTGYEHFLWARLKKWPDPAFGPGTMRRYTISAYVASPTELVLSVLHEDHFVIYLNGQLVARLTGNNTSAGRGDEVRMILQPGWNSLQFLLANDSYGCSFDIGADLARHVEAVACLVRRAQVVSGAALLPESVRPEHLDASAEYTMRSLRLTGTSAPAVTCGDSTGGSIAVGGAILEYRDGRLTLSSGLKVEGPLEYSLLQRDTERPGTSFVWLARDIYLPPAQLVGDSLACTGEAALVPAGATANVISCPAGEAVCPGPYRLYLRLRPAAATAGTVASVSVKSGNRLIASATASGASLDPLKYTAVELPFDYGGGDLVFELYAGGTVDFYFDVACLQLGR